MPRAIWTGAIAFGLVNVPVRRVRNKRVADCKDELVDALRQAS